MLLPLFLMFFQSENKFLGGIRILEYFSFFLEKKKSAGNGIIYRSFLKVDNILKWDLCNSSERILEFS